MTKKFKALQIKRQFIADKFVIGIDPASAKHQATILGSNGMQLTTPFSFANNFNGYAKLIKKIKQHIKDVNDEQIVFAIETSCNLWTTLSFYLHKRGFKVLLVSPLTTKNSRPMLSHDFSRTDPKDALLVASNAQQGFYDEYLDFPDEVKAMHKLSITYDKLRKNYVQQRTRIHAQINRLFPEFFHVLNLDTKTAMYLLQKYFLPSHFLNMDIKKEAREINCISRGNYNQGTLEQLQNLAENSIGIRLDSYEEKTERLILDTWLNLLEMVERQMQQVLNELIVLAEKTPYMSILTSIKGINKKMAALFIAETRQLKDFSHYKQLEKYAGYNLRQSQSGNYVGSRHINHIGNKRLSWILYRMTEETVKHVAEVRVKFIKRQLQKRKYRKNIVACSSNLLKLIMALVRDNRTYELRDNGFYERLFVLEKEYRKIKSLDKIRYGNVG